MRWPCWRTSASTRRDQQGRLRAGRVRRPAGRARGRLRQRRVRCRPPQAGQRLRRTPAAAARHGWARAQRDRGAAAAHRGPRAALRRRARRLQGQRQAGRDRQPARQGRQAADRRRHGLHLPEVPGPRRRQEPARGGPGRDLQGVPRPGGGHRRRDRAAHRRGRRAGVPLRGPGAAPERGRRRCDPGRPDRPGHRPRLRGGVRRGDRGSEDGVLERPHGGLRVRRLRRGHPCGCRGAHPGRRPLRGRRWRLRGRRTQARVRRGRLRAHLHRRRRQPGVPRGQGAPRARRCWRTDGRRQRVSR